MRGLHVVRFFQTARMIVLECGLLTIVATVPGCTPKVVKFNLTIPGNAPSPSATAVAAVQGTSHVCPGTPVELSWEVKGRGSLSATSGPRYQPPLCFSAPRVPSKGTRAVTPCAHDTIFRVTASHSFWRRSGSCPGPGCDNADHEVLAVSSLIEPVGGKVGDCPKGACEVMSTRPDIDWDSRLRVDTVSIIGSPVVAVLQQTPGRTLTVSHNGKMATFSADKLTSDVFREEKFSGTWILRLSECVSGCAQLPPVLDINAEAKCSR